MNGEVGFALAQVVEPNEAEGENFLGLGCISGGGDGGPGLFGLTEEGSGEFRRKSVLEVNFAGDAFQLPAGHLLFEHDTELLSKHVAATLKWKGQV